MMEPITFTFEEACSAVADVFEAIPEAWSNDDGKIWGHAFQCCVVTGVSSARNTFVLTSDDQSRLYDIARNLGYQNIAGANRSRADGILLLRIAAGELPMPKARRGRP